MTAPISLDLFIDGRFVRSRGNDRLVLHSPATGELIGESPNASREDVAAAVAAAAAACERWAALDAIERGKILNRVAEALAARIGDYAELEARVTGRPIREMRAQMGRLPEWLHYFAGIARGLEGRVLPFKGNYLNYAEYSPLGVVALLTPWNHPLLIFIKKLAAALAAGNCVVVKPSELAPLSALDFARLATEAGLPPGVLNVVPGDGATAGAALCAAPEVAKIDLTGGTATGQKIAAIAAERLVPTTLELGGKAPMVIFDDTPLDEAVNAAAFAGFIASGQTCISGTRFIVHERLYAAFVDKLAAKARAIRLGPPLDPATEMGPVISRRQHERVLALIDAGRREGGRLACGGGIPRLPAPLDRGFFVEPTVFAEVTPAMRIWREEIFGPVLSVCAFADEAEAVRLANDTPFGLGASIWTRDVRRAHRLARKLQAGIVWINDHHKNDPASPWGGFGLSGYGKENGWDALRDYMKLQSVVVRLGDEFPDWYGDGGGPRRYG